jgi:hypothetical protein
MNRSKGGRFTSKESESLITLPFTTGSIYTCCKWIAFTFFVFIAMITTHKTNIIRRVYETSEGAIDETIRYTIQMKDCVQKCNGFKGNRRSNTTETIKTSEEIKGTKQTTNNTKSKEPKKTEEEDGL